jgi:hypothetical protein
MSGAGKTAAKAVTAAAGPVLARISHTD